jgi:glycolate oxidase
MKVPEKIKKEIEAVVGKEFFLTAPEDIITYSYDATGLEYVPWGVALPANTEQVARILRLANRELFFVTPRGAGSGVTGGSLPVKSGLVLALTRMNRIVSIDQENMVAVVEPGVVNGHLQNEVEKKGLFYPPDPSSLSFSTIGGNVAECAGGARAIKYGVTKDYVLGLEVVLPTGEILKAGVQTVKGVVGYDLTRLLVGSEGTLGVITKVVLRLLPLPQAKKTLLAVFEHMQDAATAVSKIMSARIIPSTLEYMDRDSICCVEEFLHRGLPVDAGAILLIEIDGMREDVEASAQTIERICKQTGAREVKKAQSSEEADDLWLARRSIAPALFRLRPHKISEDVTIPRSRLPEMVRKLGSLKEKHGLLLANFGHAGDGNIHVNILLDKNDPDQVRRAKNMVEEIFQLTVNLGGTLSGEHGVGITKAPFLGMEIDMVGVEMMKRIKRAFDPNGILNPGKIFPDEAQKSEYLERIFPLRPA